MPSPLGALESSPVDRARARFLAEQNYSPIARHLTRTVGRPSAIEQAFSASRFGSITGTTLNSIEIERDRGMVARWCDLCQFVLSDPEMSTYYQSRVNRVAQASWVVKPGELTDEADSARAGELAADFIASSIMPRITNWSEAKKNILHAVAPGFSANEMMLRRNKQQRYWYVEKIEHRHGHRFRYDPLWNLRLYDKGTATSRDGYGKPLNWLRWIVHESPIQSGYPNVYGVMTSVVWDWLLARMGDKAWALFINKFGNPATRVTVPAGTLAAQEQAVLDKVQHMTYDSVYVMEDGTSIELDWGSPQNNNQAHLDYQTRRWERIQLAWSAVSDAHGPGENGSNAAVSSRLSAFTDPIMIADGELFCGTIERSMFRAMLYLNAHKIGVPFSEIPVPQMWLKTADDEIKQDAGDKADELALEGQSSGGDGITVRGPDADDPARAVPEMPEPVITQPDALQTLTKQVAQLTSMIEGLAKSAARAPAVAQAPPSDVATFTAAACSVGGSTRASALYEAYQAQGGRCSKQAFGRALTALGYESKRTNADGRVWSGLTLRRKST